MLETFKKSLNNKQFDALLLNEQPLLILAGAGSGKTRVITYKIAYLIKEKGYSPYDILALTFTNKAAGEMKSRVMEILDQNGRSGAGMWVSTFHSFCARFLRIEADILGYSNNFTIYNADDAKKLIKEIVKKNTLHI